MEGSCVGIKYFTMKTVTMDMDGRWVCGYKILYNGDCYHRHGREDGCVGIKYFAMGMVRRYVCGYKILYCGDCYYGDG